MEITNVCAEVMENNGDMPRSLLDDGDLKDRSGKNVQLLPGIPNEITVRHITTKIHWKDIYNLSSVSQLWSATIKSREIFQARSSSQSTQTLFAFQGHTQRGYHELPRKIYPRNEFFLYSPEDDSCYQLPANPDIDIQPSDSECECECVYLEGKLYVFGGASLSSKLDRTNVFVYDLVEQRGWKACAPMQPRMVNFQCGIIHGKIYVFNGVKVQSREDLGQIVYDSEEDFGYTVYDPEQDSWSPLTCNTCSPNTRKLYQKMISVGEKLIVCQGPTGRDDIYLHSEGGKLSANIYLPTTGEWRTVEEFLSDDTDLIIKIDDKIHRVYRPSPQMFDEGTGILYADMYFRDGAVVDDVLYLLDSRHVYRPKDQDDDGELSFHVKEIVLMAIPGWKGHVTFEADTHEEIEVIGTSIEEIHESPCCLPMADRQRFLFRCPVRL